jgi:hypothetical protein
LHDQALVLAASEKSRQSAKRLRRDVRVLSEEGFGRVARHEARQEEVQRHRGPDRDGEEG